MLNLKKTAVAVLALGSSAVFAGTMGPVCAPGNVTVPCEKTAWDVGAQALYLQPVYAAEGSFPNAYVPIGVSPIQNLNAPNANYQWGFMVEGSYHFGMGNDVNVNWYRVHNTNNKGQTVQFATQTAANIAANASLNTQWDQVDVEMGQHVDFGDMKYIRLHGGVEWARIYDGINTNDIVGFPTNYNSMNSDYNGFGPRGGIDATYELGNGFGIYGKGAGSILVGRGTANVSTTALTLTPSTGNASYGKTLIVPELEAKLGVKYDYAMAQGDITLDVGWMWINYFNAQINVAADSIGTTANHVNRGQVSYNDFGLQGLYFGAKWVGNV